MLSPTPTVLVLPPIWKMAEPALPGAATTPTSRGRGPEGVRRRTGGGGAGGGAASRALRGTRSSGWAGRAWGSSPSCSIQGSPGGGGGRPAASVAERVAALSGDEAGPPAAGTALPPAGGSRVGAGGVTGAAGWAAGPKLRRRSTSSRLRSCCRDCWKRFHWLRARTPLAAVIRPAPANTASSSSGWWGTVQAGPRAPRRPGCGPAGAALGVEPGSADSAAAPPAGDSGLRDAARSSAAAGRRARWRRGAGSALGGWAGCSSRPGAPGSRESAGAAGSPASEPSRSIGSSGSKIRFISFSAWRSQ